MNCEQVHQQLSPYLDGELDSNARSSIQEHLSSCPDCSLRFEEFKTLDNKISETVNNNGATSEGFTNKLLKRAERNFDQNQAHPESNTTVQALEQKSSSILEALTLTVGLLVGTYMGFGFLEVMPDQFPSAVQASTNQQTPSTTTLAESTPPDNLAVVSLNDAYFEQGEADDSGR